MRFSRRLVLLLLSTVAFLALSQLVTSEGLPAGQQMRNWPVWAHIATGTLLALLIITGFVFDVRNFFRDSRDSWKVGKKDKTSA